MQHITVPVAHINHKLHTACQIKLPAGYPMQRIMQHRDIDLSFHGSRCEDVSQLANPSPKKD